MEFLPAGVARRVCYPTLPENVRRGWRATGVVALLNRRETTRSGPERHETCQPCCRCDAAAGCNVLSCRLQRGKSAAENSSSFVSPSSRNGGCGGTSAHTHGIECHWKRPILPDRAGQVHG